MNKIIYLLICIFFNTSAVFAIQDTFVEETLCGKNLEPPLTHTVYNYQSTEKIPVIIQSSKIMKSEKDVSEGSLISMKVYSDVEYKGEIIIPKDTILTAKIETTVPSGMNGIPASIIIGSFDIPNIDTNKLTYSYEIVGQDRSLWVYPLKWALTILPPTGSLTNFIFGGHAKLNTKKKIKLYYYPDWI